MTTPLLADFLRTLRATHLLYLTSAVVAVYKPGLVAIVVDGEAVNDWRHGWFVAAEWTRNDEIPKEAISAEDH